MSVAVEAFRVWREQPWQFVRDVFGAEPDAWQDEALHALVRHNRLALKACKGPGKSTFLAWVGWWFLLTRPHPKVVCTSISGDNLRDNLWAELSKWQKRSPLLQRLFSWTAERIFAKEHPETWWISARQWPKSADANQQADTLAGVHADSVLFLIDEAGGIPDAVVATAEAGLANAIEEKGTEAKLILAGNPTHLSGPLYRACTRERALWWVKEISSAPDDPSRTPRVSKQWAQEQIDKYGADNPWVLVNVFGQFPPGQSNTLVDVETAAAAARRTILEAEYYDAVKVLGVDVARFGDDETVFFLRQGKATWRPKVFRNLNTMDVADQLTMLIDRVDPDATFVDVTGIGAGVVDRCLQRNYPVVGVDFGGKALSGKFLNKRAEMWWTMADWVKTGCIPDDATLISELPGPTYRFTPDGKLVLESKDDMKKRGVPSPNRADALALTFAAPVAHRGIRGKLEEMKRRQPTHDYNPYAQGG